MHGNRRQNILDMAREKVAQQMASVANPPAPRKVQQVSVPEAPKPAVSKPAGKAPEAKAGPEVV